MLVFLGLAILIIALVVLGRTFLVGRGSSGSLSPAVLDQARRQGAAPDLIYMVEVKGYEIAEQSVGVINDEGFGAFYSAKDGRRVQLRIDRGTMTDALCPGLPVTDMEPLTALVRCERDEVGWYREGGGHHEYIAVRDGHLIKLAGSLGDVDRATLKAAVAGARHVATTAPAAPSPSHTPVTRGDLPTTGDGAPIQNTGPGG
ncbi:hypothetical protein GCM10009555_063220 [Acrocarpospora macrocephala]|uniref:DUF4367 domain-containing protein n=1 Tax=Acrocarpospora macrocephala TaxID=150177 RepID=A0A5M3WLG5_9ACTN|nr:hypothetical protein Amac_013380 [Acrocarpospora macrocephala]